MSRYASKAELVEMIRLTVDADHNGIGVKGARNYNLAAIVREVEIVGDRYYGYTTMKVGDELVEVIRRNLRKGARR